MTDHSEVDLTPLATELDTLREENATMRRALHVLARKDLELITLEDRLDLVDVWCWRSRTQQEHDGTAIGVAAAIVKAAEKLGVEVPE